MEGFLLRIGIGLLAGYPYGGVLYPGNALLVVELVPQPLINEDGAGLHLVVHQPLLLECLKGFDDFDDACEGVGLVGHRGDCINHYFFLRLTLSVSFTVVFGCFSAYPSVTYKPVTAERNLVCFLLFAMIDTFYC